MEVNWSLLTEGMTLPVENQIVFGRLMNGFLQKGEQKAIFDGLFQQSQGDHADQVGGQRHHQDVKVYTHDATSSSRGNSTAQMAAAPMVQRTMAMPSEISFKPGIQVKRQLITRARPVQTKRGFSCRA